MLGAEHIARTTRPRRVEEPSALVARLFAANNHDDDKTIADVLLRADANASLRRWLLEKGARSAVGEQRRTYTALALGRESEIARKAWAHDAPGHERARERSAIVPGLVANSLFNAIIRVDGKNYKLGDATADVLNKAAEHQEMQGRTMLRTALFYRTTAGALLAGKTVRESMTLKRLQAIKRETFESAA